MLGLVSVKTPPKTPPLRISVLETPTQDQAQTLTQRRSELVNFVLNSKPTSSFSRLPPSLSPSQSKFLSRKPPLDNPNSEATLNNPDLGPFLLKLARDIIASSEGPNKALDYALRASKSFKWCSGGAEGEPSLDLAMTLYVLAAISRRRF
ncbi:protein kinesin light chain-related 1 [Quercus suber]|uniref:Protein kinesin light chain-related 1 n=1 Tax=Quercus suber TaxID=58331 RepID=A0AAW0M1F6_QUESU|nr:isoform 2 of protein kinesin light chain-related 1 [Quercus suber]